MNPDDLDLSQGRLSELSVDSADGLPEEYLRPSGDLDQGALFYESSISESDLTTQLPPEISRTKYHSLYVEEATMSTIDDQCSEGNLTSDTMASSSVEGEIKARREALPPLNIDTDPEQTSSGLVFSPGGTEAYVFTQASPSPTEDGSKKPEITPREIHDKIFIEDGATAVTAPKGERPKTVGQSDDTPQARRTYRLPPVAPVERTRIKGRLDDYKVSLDLELDSLPSTTESSPRLGRDRRIPVGRDQYLQDPDSVILPPLLPEGFTTDAESLASPATTPHGHPLSDRAGSPSIASVVSGHSVASSVTGRKNLLWDSEGDLGLGFITATEFQKQHKASESLSTLEKMAIENYASFLRTEPEGKNPRDRVRPPRLPEPPGRDEDMRQMRINKYAESLLRQRELRQMASAAAASHQESASKQQSTKQRPKGKSKSDTTPDASPTRRHKKKLSSKALRQKYGAPMKSCSLTDLDLPDEHRQELSRHFRSSSDVSQWVLKNFSEPSSSSSNSTVVPLQLRDGSVNKDLQNISTDPSSLPVQLQGMLAGVDDESTIGSTLESLSLRDPPNQLTTRPSESSLASRPSETRSFETVVARHTTDSSPTLKSDSDDDDEPSSYFADRNGAEGKEDDESRKANPPPKPFAAWNEARSQSLPPGGGQSSRPSSTTSEDEKPRRRSTNTSTMESSQIDRAKSFEYFPGESFPLQENSSSYEYLPGHMVEDRPGTVVSNHRQEADLTGISSFTGTENDEDSSLSSFDRRVVGGAKRKLELPENTDPLVAATRELKDKSKELLVANMHYTKLFHKKIKKYIEFISTPSHSPEDSRTKQELADKLLNMIKQEESKIQRPLSVELTTSRLDLSEGESEKSGDTSTRKLDSTDAPPFLTTPAPKDSSSDQSRESDWLKSHEKVKNMDKTDVLEYVQRMRTERMRRLKKEIRKLEKLETAVLGQAFKGSNLELVDMSSSTDGIKTPEVTKRRGVEGKSASGSDSVPAPRRARPSSARPSSGRPSSGRPSSGRPSGGRPRSSGEQAKTKKAEAPKSNETKTVPVKKNEFGQTFPTPREEARVSKTSTSSSTDPVKVPSSSSRTISVQTTNSSMSKSVASGTTPRPKVTAVPKLKPTAYYLPLDNAGPIKIGKRALKAKDGTLDKENRNILANYISGLDSSVVPLARQKSADAEPKSQERPPPTSRLPKSLQEALIFSRPLFVQRSEHRMALLQRAREQRLENAERKRQWAEQVAQQTPRRRRVDPPEFVAVPVQRVFSHRQMVEQTRRKYEKLPEVRESKYVMKKQLFSRTNRVMAEVYKQRLQQKVLRGRVSLTHHANVIGY